MHPYEPSWLNLPIGAPARRSRTIATALLATIAAFGGMTVGLMAEANADASTHDPRIRSEVSIGDTSVVDTSVVLDFLTLPMTAGQWRYGSVPSVERHISLLEIPNVHNAELHWYSPYGVVKEFDLNPSLTNAQGAQNNHPVLALSIPRRPLSAAPSDSLWASLTYSLDLNGLDLSKSRFIEVWVNDWRDESRIRGLGARLHVDLGVVSEDQMRSPDQPPNQWLDTEDQSSDNVLELTEDTGVDAANNATEDALPAPLDLSTANEQDRAGDDYENPSSPFLEIDPRRWVHTNGTEGNRLVLPSPDTEDLNLNGRLDTQEGYDEYTIDLSDGSTRYLATDVYAEFAGKAVPHPPSTDNGWRRYRIPIDDAERLEFGVPYLELARHVRVWVDGIVSPDGPADGPLDAKRPLLMLGGLRIAGESQRPIFPATVSAVMRPWPNPARAEVFLDFALTRTQPVDLIVYDLGGRRVRKLRQGTLQAGRYNFPWDGRDGAGARVSPGLYLVEARGPGLAVSAKVLLVE